MEKQYNLYNLEPSFKKYLFTENISPISLKNYMSDFRHFAGWMNVISNEVRDLATKDFSVASFLRNDLTPKVISEYRSYLTTNNIPHKTINRRLSTIRKFCSFCISQGWMKENPAKQILNIKNQRSNLNSSLTTNHQPLITNRASKSPPHVILSEAKESLPAGRQVAKRKNIVPDNKRGFGIQYYIAFLIILIFISVLGAGIYNQFFVKQEKTLAFATTPTRAGRILSFQGRLTDSLGNPITTATNVTYNLYNISSGGVALYTAGPCSTTPDSDGIFNALIGGSGYSPTPPQAVCGTEVGSSIFTENADVYLGITVAADAEMTPRQQIANVGYAMNAETLQGLPPGTGTSTIPYINSDGNLLIAAASPGIRSTYTSTDFTLSSAKAAVIQSAGTGDIVLQATESGALKFRTAGADDTVTRLIVANGGNVGIGDLTPASLFTVGTGDLFQVNSSGIISSIDGVAHTIDDVGGNLTLASNSNTISLNDNVTFAGTTTLNGQAYTWPGTQTADYVLKTNGTGTLSWTAQTGGGGGSSNWTIANGSIYPINSTLDAFIGGTASSSAKFAFLNVNSGTPTASVSGSISNVATFLDGNGNFSTTNRQDLTIGNSSIYNTTGNVLINPNGTGNVGIGDTSPASMFTVGSGDLFQINSSGAIAAAAGVVSSGNIDLSSLSAGGIAKAAVTTGRLAIATAGTDYENPLTFSNGLTRTVNAVKLGGTLTATTDIPLGGFDMTFSGTGNVGIGTTGPDAKLDLLSTTGEQLRLTYTDGSVYGGLTLNSSGDLVIDTTGNDIVTSDRLTVGTTTPGLGKLNVVGAETGKALAIFDETGDQNILTASASGTTKFVITHAGNVGIGVTSPTNKLEIAGASSTISNDSGDITIDSASNNISFAGDNLININNANISNYAYFAGGTTYYVDQSGNAKFLDLIVADTGNPGLTVGNGTIGFAKIGSATFSDNSTTYLAFDTDSNGTNDFQINDDGSVTFRNNITSATTTEGTVFYDSDSIGSAATDHLYLRGSDSAWHRLALDMTKYASNSATLTNGGYLEIAHNQATNDILAEGWIYDGAKYVKIDNLTGSPNISDPSLVAWWKAEESSGTLDNFENTASNDLTASGAATFQQTGKKNYAISLDGTDDKFVSRYGVDNDSLDFGANSFTLGGWFKHDTIATNPDYTITKYSPTASINTGDGADGAITVSTSKNINTAIIASGRSTYADGIAYRVTAPADSVNSVARYSGSDTISNGIAAGDDVLLINLRGSTTDFADVGNYEIMTVQSSTASTITFTQNISKSFDGTSAGNQLVVVQRVPNYTSVTVSSGGTITASTWDDLATTPTGGAGYLTGIVVFKATGTVSVESGGTITTSSLGYTGGTVPGDGGGGFCGVDSGGDQAVNGPCGGGGGSTGQGDGTAAPGGTGSATSGGAGGGSGGAAAYNNGWAGAGGGAGYGTFGYLGQGYGTSTNGGTNTSGNGGTGSSSTNGYAYGGGGGGGGTYGDVALADIFLGTGGGGGSSYSQSGGAGGKGGGIVLVAANTITVTGTISSSGANGAGGGGTDGGGGGGGAGGSVKLSAPSLTLGTGLVTASAGSGGGGNKTGGNGGVGRIAVEYSTSLSGTSTPGANSSQVSAESGGYKLYMDATGHYVFGIDDDTTSFPEDSATTETNYADNAWHHVIAVKTGTSSLKLYVDGQELASDYSLAATGSISNTNPFYLGADYDGTSNTWAGLFDEVFVYNRALTAGEVQEMYRSNSRYQLEQTNNNTVRLYNYSGETQNLRLDATVFGADLAEWYTVDDESIGPGDLVATTGRLDENGVPILRKTNISNDPQIVGAISTKAGNTLGIEAPNRRLLALAGRIPVKVASDSAAIQPGDQLTSSVIPGYAKKAGFGNRTIGKAVENWIPNSDKSQIIIIVGNSYQFPTIADLQDIVITQIDNLEKISYQLISASQGIIENIGVYSEALISHLQAGLIESQKIVSPIAEIGTLNVSEKIRSPIVETTDLVATGTAQLNEIKPAEKDLFVILGNEETPESTSGGSWTSQDDQKGRLAKLIIKGLEGKTVTTIDAAGNASFSGQIIADSLQINNDATVSGNITSNTLTTNEASVSGTLIAKEIQSDNINEIQRLLADIKTQPIPDPNNYQNLSDQQFSNVTIEQLTVTGQSNLYNVSVSNSLLIGTTVIDQNSIISLSSELKLSALSTINLLDGAVIIAKDGTITTKGELIAEKGIRTNEIKGLTDADKVNINNLAINNLTINDKYLDATTSAAIIAASDNFEKNGIFAPAIETATASAGLGILPANQFEVIIYNDSVKKNSLIYLTPTSVSPINTQLTVVKKEDCSFSEQCRKYFKIGIDSPISQDNKFNWLIIN